MATLSSDLRIDIDRLSDRLAALAEIGAIEGTEGCARLALTDEDKAGRDLVVSWMRDLDLTITVDSIGNVVGDAVVETRAFYGPKLTITFVKFLKNTSKSFQNRSKIEIICQNLKMNNRTRK